MNQAGRRAVGHGPHAADAAIGEIRKDFGKSGNFLFKERLYSLQRHVPLGKTRAPPRNDDVDASHPFVDVTGNILFIIFYDSVIDDLMPPVCQSRLNHQAVCIIRTSPAIADSQNSRTQRTFFNFLSQRNPSLQLYMPIRPYHERKQIDMLLL